MNPVLTSPSTFPKWMSARSGRIDSTMLRPIPPDLITVAGDRLHSRSWEQAGYRELNLPLTQYLVQVGYRYPQR
jgi:hypothetical protein